MSSFVNATLAATNTSNTSSSSSGHSDDAIIIFAVLGPILVLLAALFGGLQLGIMSLDTVSLQIIAETGREPDRTYAQRLLPIRQSGNFVLCTLICGQALVNMIIVELSGEILTGFLSTIVSTVVIFLMAEVLPSALCSAHALPIGSKSIPVLKVFMFILFPFCYPLAKMFDALLGTTDTDLYERESLRKLIMVHAEKHGKESGLEVTEAQLMVGAMEIHQDNVEQAMTPLGDVFMVSSTEIINDDLICTFQVEGHSRVPVYEDERSNVIGYVLTKDLLLIDPHEQIQIHQMLRFYPHAVVRTPTDTKIAEVLRLAREGRTNLVFVHAVGDPSIIVGIITVEDVIEELLDREILDEHDVKTDVKISTRGAQSRALKGARPCRLGPNQLTACAYYLRESVPVFKEWELQTLKDMIRAANVVDVRAPHRPSSIGLDDPHNVWLYKQEVPSNNFSLLLSGKVELLVGTVQPFTTICHAWSFFGDEVFGVVDGNLFTPTFQVRLMEHCRLLQVTKAVFEKFSPQLGNSSFPAASMPGIVRKSSMILSQQPSVAPLKLSAPVAVGGGGPRPSPKNSANATSATPQSPALPTDVPIPNTATVLA